MNHVECIEDAYLVIEDGIITEYGEMSDSVILNGTKNPVILNGTKDPVILNGTKWSEESLGERSFADAQDDKNGAQEDKNGTQEDKNGAQEDKNGALKEKNGTQDENIEYIDAEGGFVMPCFCDSHTHIVYAGCRDGEFRDNPGGRRGIFLDKQL